MPNGSSYQTDKGTIYLVQKLRVLVTLSFGTLEVLYIYDVHNFLSSVWNICFLVDLLALVIEYLPLTYLSVFPQAHIPITTEQIPNSSFYIPMC